MRIRLHCRKASRKGQDVLFIAERRNGLDDDSVLSLAISERRLLLTQDMGFGRLARRRFVSAPGIVFLRIPPQRASIRWRRLEETVDSYGERLFGRLIVIEEARARSRALQMSR